MEINKTSAMFTGNNKETNKKGSLSMEDFLQIMAAEIKNQSPMGSEGGGGSKTDYISQLAQFTTLEQMSSISESLDLLTFMSQQQYSFSLIGKEVTLLDEGQKMTGTVDSVKFDNGFALIQVNKEYYYLGSIVEVLK